MNKPMQTGLTVIAGIWIFGAMVFYCVRYTAVLYRTHQSDFDAFLGRLGSLFGSE